MASVKLDTVGMDVPNFIIWLNANEISWKEIEHEGPSGWPVIEYTGDLIAIKRMIRIHWKDTDLFKSIKQTQKSFRKNVGYTIIAEAPDRHEREIVLGVRKDLSEYVTWIRYRGVKDEYYHGYHFISIIDAVKDFEKRIGI